MRSEIPLPDGSPTSKLHPQHVCCGATIIAAHVATHSSRFNIPCQTVDSSQGKGNMMVWGKADWALGLTGREVMERLYLDLLHSIRLCMFATYHTLIHKYA